MPRFALTLAAIALATALASAHQDPPAPAAAPLATVSLRFEAPPGAALRYVHAIDHALRVERIEMRIGDAPEVNAVSATLEARGGARVEFVDETPATDARGLRRRYEAAAASIEMRDVREGAPETPLSRVAFEADLAGTSVVHVPLAEGGTGRHYDAREGPEALLALVAGAPDWAALLPAGGVRIGDSWTVPPEALSALLAPAGEVGWREPAEGADPELVRSFRAGLGGNLHVGFEGDVSGTVTARVHELGLADGRPFAVLRYEFDVELIADRTEMARRRMLDPERGMGVEVQEATSVRRLEGRADLRWDVYGRRPISARSTATEGLELAIRVASAIEGGFATQTLVLEGPLASELSCAPAPPVPAPGPAR